MKKGVKPDQHLFKATRPPWMTPSDSLMSGVSDTWDLASMRRVGMVERSARPET